MILNTEEMSEVGSIFQICMHEAVGGAYSIQVSCSTDHISNSVISCIRLCFVLSCLGCHFLHLYALKVESTLWDAKL